ncbi:MAG TPA: DUF1499 domain-containing protein [Hyphomonas sp.]|nr:DUF1499 domain-containing protein [Hyphomonas sp.]MCB9962651.1 DUF1499 domain-containing protein [Hyphomonas sp.]MCB9970070.1 DUF1499 domain-containing protein [Hyphomonas sp.]MCC0050371.1 DUF1499 domain-containing protein [Rhodobiaceae bacterium]HPE48578.1 DUF1499 domain-containing protein [Hyphomonas sp.]
MADSTSSDQNGGWRGKFAGLALAVAVFGVLWFFIAAGGTKLGLWDWKVGFIKLTMGWGPKIVQGALGLSVLAIILSLVAAPRKRPFMLALGALLISGLSMGRLIAAKANAERLPPLHDIQTDWTNPIMPSAALLAARDSTGGYNKIEEAPVIPDNANARWPGTGGRLVSEVQEEAEFDPDRQRKEVSAPYPKIETLVLPSVSFDMAYQAALDTVEAKGWKVVTADPQNGHIEATDTTFWFEFKDDVMIRVLPDGADGARIDARSVSRVGLSDLGANAKRVNMLLDDIETRLR